MSRRRAATVLAATVATAAIALPAWAHASFDKSQVPADTEVDLTFRSPQERASVNVKVEALAPKEWTVLECTAPLNWECSIDQTSEAPQTVLVWEATGTTSVPEKNFAFRVRTPGEDEQGVYAWPVVQTYADGHEAAWIGDTAPTIQVGDSDAPVVDNDETPSHGGDAEEPGPSSSAAPESDPATAPSSEPADDDAEGESEAPSTNEAVGIGAGDDDVAAEATAEVAEPQDRSGAPTGLIVAVIAMAVLGGAAFLVRGRFAR